MTHSRFAIYYLPPDGALAAFGAAWLGWDIETGQPHHHFELPGLDAVTQAPRKYGFHATLKPPFHLAEGATPCALSDAVANLARKTPAAKADGLQIAPLGRFLALVPVGDAADIARVAADCVTTLDPFRAPPTEAELARRRGKGLNAAKEEMLQRWGYPHVLDEFRFHMTLTGRLAKDDIAPWRTKARALLPRTDHHFSLNSICLVGERADGHFELIKRFFLGTEG